MTKSIKWKRMQTIGIFFRKPFFLFFLSLFFIIFTKHETQIICITRATGSNARWGLCHQTNSSFLITSVRYFTRCATDWVILWGQETHHYNGILETEARLNEKTTLKLQDAGLGGLLRGLFENTGVSMVSIHLACVFTPHYTFAKVIEQSVTFHLFA